MADDFEKKYYKIKDVAEMLDVAPSTLRYWEREFPYCQPTRSPSNVRYYKPQDIETLRIIRYLVKEKGLRIEAAREQMRLNRHNISRRVEVIDRLTKIRGELKEMLAALNKRKD